MIKSSKKKRKGFTLIELMGVLIIIGILSAILVPVINNSIKNNKQKLYQQQLEGIVLSAKNLLSDNRVILPEVNDDYIYITLGQLRSLGYAEKQIINPINNENIPDSLIVKVLKLNDEYQYIIINDMDISIVENNNIRIIGPTKIYIKAGAISSYIVTVNEENDKIFNGIKIDTNKIQLSGQATDSRYQVVGDNGFYKVIVLGGKKEGDVRPQLNNIIDINGNKMDLTETNTKVSNIIVDNTAPECSWSGENKTWTSSDVTINVTGKDESSGMNSSYKSKTWLYSAPDQEITTDSLLYTVKDNAGNEKKCSSTVNIYHDTKAPTFTSITNPTNGNWVNYDFALTLDVTDNGSGVNKYQYRYNNTEWKDSGWSNESSHITTNYSAERNELTYIRVCDNAGNCSKEKSSQIRIDKTKPGAPSVSLVSSDWNEKDNDTWYNFDIYVSGQADGNNPNPISSDGEGGSGINHYEISDNNSDWHNWNYNWNNNMYCVNWDGTTYRYVRAIDNAGNISEVTTKTIKRDTVAPTIGAAEWCSPDTATDKKICRKFYLADNLSDTLNLYRSHCVEADTIQSNSCYNDYTAVNRLTNFLNGTTLASDNKSVAHTWSRNSYFELHTSYKTNYSIQYALKVCDQAGNCTGIESRRYN